MNIFCNRGIESDLRFFEGKDIWVLAKLGHPRGEHHLTFYIRIVKIYDYFVQYNKIDIYELYQYRPDGVRPLGPHGASYEMGELYECQPESINIVTPLDTLTTEELLNEMIS